ncbi:MAG: hypothetical protein ACPGLV_14440, partial [Bacteroidia bacterium]
MNLTSEHILGQKIGEGKKQLLIAIASIHGNEPAGVKAIERVFKVLINSDKNFKGAFIGMAGNLLAIRHNKRYLKTDLNRIWTESDLEIADSIDSAIEFPDHFQLKTLKKTIDYYLNLGYEKVCIVDLHTTSANGGVFIVCPDNE